jgi:hypothetical protein
MTPREFTIVCEENVERTHDEIERAALSAIFNAASANGVGNGKKKRLPKVSELYDREANATPAKKKADAEQLMEQQRHTDEWLAQYDLSNL